MFKIGEFSRISQVPAKTLRYYDEIGLLEPASADQFTGYRYYSASQLPRLNRILALKEMGLSLAQIGQLLDEDVSPDELRGMFRLKQAEIQQRVEDEQARLERVATRLKQIEQEGKMPVQDVAIKNVDQMNILSIRFTAPTGEAVGQIMGECYMALQGVGVQPIAPPFTIFHDTEFKEQNLDVEIAFPMDSTSNHTVPLDDTRKLTMQQLPAIQAASIIHEGQYEDFATTYGVIGQWIEDHSYTISGPAREIYINPGMDGLTPVTEIQYPVTKA